jgi:hypothetical protein
MAEIRFGRVARRRALLISAPILLIVGISILAPAAIRAAVHSGLAALGFNNARGGTVSLSLRHVRIASIELGERSRATVAATFSAGSLLRRRLETIDVSDTELHGTVALNGALELDGFTAPASAQAPAGRIDLPADRVNLAGIVLELETPAGKTQVTAEGAMLGTDGGLHLTGAIGIAGDIFTGNAPADFNLTPAGWSLSLNPIHIVFSGAAEGANPIEGHLTLASRSPTGLTGDAELKGEKLAIQAMPILLLSLALKADAGGLSGRFQLAPQQGGSGIDASLKSDDAGVTALLNMDFNEIRVFSKVIGREVQGPVRAKLTMHADPPQTKRPVTLDLTYDGIAPGGVALHNARLKASGLFDSSQNAVMLTSCGPFSLDSATLSGLVLTKLSGCLGPAPDGATFEQDPQGRIGLAGTIGNLTATVPSADEILAEARIPTLEVTMTAAEGRPISFAASLDGGAIEVPSLGAGLRSLGIKTSLVDDGTLSGTVSGSFGPAGPKSPALPVTGTIGGKLGTGLTLAATAGSLVKLSLTGQSAKLDMPATELGEAGADLLRLAPGLTTTASKLSGTLAVSLSADWSGPALRSSGNLTLKDTGATTPNFTVEGLDGAITLTSLSPLSTAESQVLTMRRLVAGLPLTDGRITFDLNRHNRLNIADAHWTLAGGRVGTYGQQLDLYGPDQNLGLVVKGVDLAELLKLANVNGLSAEGTVEGAIPLRRIKDIIRIEHGVLQTRAPGVIRYDPAETPSFLQGRPGEGTAILRDALKDFHYQQLSLTIDGLLGGEEQIKLKLNGANPALYGGVPVALNVNLSGALDSIARSSVEAYTNPTKTVHRKLQTKPEEKK